MQGLKFGGEVCLHMHGNIHSWDYAYTVWETAFMLMLQPVQNQSRKAVIYLIRCCCCCCCKTDTLEKQMDWLLHHLSSSLIKPARTGSHNREAEYDNTHLFVPVHPATLFACSCWQKTRTRSIVQRFKEVLQQNHATYDESVMFFFLLLYYRVIKFKRPAFWQNRTCKRCTFI